MWDTESEAENESEAGLQVELGFLESKVGSDFAEPLAEHMFEPGPWTGHGFEPGALTERGLETGSLAKHGFEPGPWNEYGFAPGP